MARLYVLINDYQLFEISKKGAGEIPFAFAVGV